MALLSPGTALVASDHLLGSPRAIEAVATLGATRSTRHHPRKSCSVFVAVCLGRPEKCRVISGTR